MTPDAIDMPDPHRLQRFVDAQSPVYAGVCAELAAGSKTSHWMWFVFPQLEGLGRSDIARHFGIKSRAEAEAYQAHPVLGPRLAQCSALVLHTKGRGARQIFGPVDELKLCSSMTLFAHAAPHEPVFRQVIETFFDGREDARTNELL